MSGDSPVTELSVIDEDIVAALAEGLWGDEDDRRRQARKLLPTVRHIAEQRAAEELLALAADADEDPDDPVQQSWQLRARAAALTATPNHGTDVTT